MGAAPKAATRAANPLAPKPPHYAAKAKHVIFLFMNGGPSHVDTFDYKPMLEKWSHKKGYKGRKYMPSPFEFTQHGTNRIWVSELYPHLSKYADDLCIIRSMHTNTPNHEPGLLMMNWRAEHRSCLSRDPGEKVVSSRQNARVESSCSQETHAASR